MVIIPVHLSGSTDGKPHVVSGTAASSSTTVHTATSLANTYDELYIFASNLSTSPVTLTISWGHSSGADAELVAKAVTLPPSSPPIPIMTGQRLNNGAVVKAWASSASVINLTGNVNRISV